MEELLYHHYPISHSKGTHKEFINETAGATSLIGDGIGGGERKNTGDSFPAVTPSGRCTMGFGTAYDGASKKTHRGGGRADWASQVMMSS